MTFAAASPTFPFGRPIRPVEQTDRSPKRIFVLGVYSSAVHARWVGADGKQLIAAVAVASEPYIFWRGDEQEAREIVESIPMPPGSGTLQPAFNGPSGRSLDDNFLAPLGLTRANAWLCDLLPESRMNPSQKAALKRAYLPQVQVLGLPTFNFPEPKDAWTDAARRDDISGEILESQTEVLVTLGDHPLEWFARYHGAHRRLGQYGKTAAGYGQLHEISIGGRSMQLLPLVHPRQADGLGAHSSEWRQLHSLWSLNVAPRLLVTSSGDPLAERAGAVGLPAERARATAGSAQPPRRRTAAALPHCSDQKS